MGFSAQEIHVPKKSLFGTNKFDRLVKVLVIPFGVVLGVFFVFGLIAFGQYLILKNDASDVKEDVEKFKEAAEKQNLVEVRIQNSNLKTDLSRFQKDLSHYKILAKLPVVSGYYSDIGHFIKAGLVGTETAEIGLKIIEPYSDSLGLSGQKARTNAEQKTQILARDVLPQIPPHLDTIEAKLEEIKFELSKINASRYPKSYKIGDLSIHDFLLETKNQLSKINSAIPVLKPILEVAPSILGQPEEKNYLILFQNDKELRPTGGFIGSYALAKFRNGRLVNIFSEDIYRLEDRGYKHDVPTDYLRKYLYQSELGIRDANIFPDFKQSATYFESLYHRIPGTEKKIDGIVGIDTELVRSIIAITGPVVSKNLNETFSAELNSQGIPDVTYKLELLSEIKNGGKDRKAAVGELMSGVIAKASSLSVEKFKPFLETLFQETQEKHLLFYFKDKAAQELVEKYNSGGRIQETETDYLHVNNSNFGGLKANFYVRFHIDQKIAIAADGTIKKTVTTTITDPEKSDRWLNFVYANWQRVMVPFGSKIVSKKVQRDFTQAQEEGKQVFRSYSRTMPLSATQATYTYILPFKLKKGDPYRLLMQKQPGDNFTTVSIWINGVLRKEFDLNQDTNLELPV